MTEQRTPATDYVPCEQAHPGFTHEQWLEWPRAAAPQPAEAVALLLDVVRHWDAGDIDHDYDAISETFDAAREYLQRTLGTLKGPHEHPATPAPASSGLDVRSLIRMTLQRYKGTVIQVAVLQMLDELAPEASHAVIDEEYARLRDTRATTKVESKP